MITLYHTGCPKCRIIESKLKQKEVEYQECTDIDIMVGRGILSVPYLEVDGELFDFMAATKWLNERN